MMLPLLWEMINDKNLIEKRKECQALTRLMLNFLSPYDIRYVEADDR